MTVSGQINQPNYFLEQIVASENPFCSNPKIIIISFLCTSKRIMCPLTLSIKILSLLYLPLRILSHKMNSTKPPQTNRPYIALITTPLFLDHAPTSWLEMGLHDMSITIQGTLKGRHVQVVLQNL